MLLFSLKVMPYSLWSHGLKHVRLPNPSWSPGVCSNSCPLSWWCYPVFSFPAILILLPLVFPSIRVFSNELAPHIRWPRYWNFSFSISPFNEYSRLISFRIDWFDLLAVQEALKSLHQHSSKASSSLLCLAFVMVQLSHPYMTTGKTIALTRQTFVSKVTSLLFNQLHSNIKIKKF